MKKEELTRLFQAYADDVFRLAYQRENGQDFILSYARHTEAEFWDDLYFYNPDDYTE